MVKKEKKVQKREEVGKKEPENFGEIHRTKIKVIGIGGGGGSIISEIAPQIKKVDFIAANVDAQALKMVSREVRKFQFGKSLTGGLGCGMNPEVGRRAAEEARERIKKELENADFCIFVACLGGGTGSGSTPVFAEVANSLKTKTFGIFTLPFKFEGLKRAQIANESLERVKSYLNAFMVISNEKIFQLTKEKTSFKEALSIINQILAQSLKGLIETIYTPGLINIDFADLKTIFEKKGKLAYLSSSEAKGENRAEEVIRKVLNSPLRDYDFQKAERILFNITASKNLRMFEVAKISRSISELNRSGKIIFGISENRGYQDKIRVTLLAVGCEKEREKREKGMKRERKEKKRKKGERKRRGEKKKRRGEKKIEKKGEREEKKIHLQEEGKYLKENQKEKKKEKTKREEKEENSPSKNSIFTSLEGVKKIRRNALEVKKEIEEAEREILEEERKWEPPAFLRRIRKKG